MAAGLRRGPRSGWRGCRRRSPWRLRPLWSSSSGGLLVERRRRLRPRRRPLPVRTGCARYASSWRQRGGACWPRCKAAVGACRLAPDLSAGCNSPTVPGTARKWNPARVHGLVPIRRLAAFPLGSLFVRGHAHSAGGHPAALRAHWNAPALRRGQIDAATTDPAGCTQHAPVSFRCGTAAPFAGRPRVHSAPHRRGRRALHALRVIEALVPYAGIHSVGHRRGPRALVSPMWSSGCRGPPGGAGPCAACPARAGHPGAASQAEVNRATQATKQRTYCTPRETPLRCAGAAPGLAGGSDVERDTPVSLRRGRAHRPASRPTPSARASPRRSRCSEASRLRWAWPPWRLGPAQPWRTAPPHRGWRWCAGTSVGVYAVAGVHCVQSAD